MRIAVFHNIAGGGAKRSLYEHMRWLYGAHEMDLYEYDSTPEEFLDVRPFCKSVYRYHIDEVRGSATIKTGRIMVAVNAKRLEKVHRDIANDIDARGYDVIYTTHCDITKAPPLLKYARTPKLYYCQEPPRRLHEHDMAAKPGFKGQMLEVLHSPFKALRREGDYRSVRMADAVAANSHYSAEFIYRVYGVFADVVYNGVNTDYFRPMGMQRTRGAITSIGALQPEKGHIFVLDSISKMKKKNQVKLTIVTERENREFRDTLEEVAKKRQIPLEIRFRISEDELVRTYNRSMVTAFAPVMEPFGLISLESMACGTPVVGVKEGGLRESIRHDVTSILTDRDTAKYAKALDMLIDGGKTWDRLSVCGRQEMENKWKWEIVNPSIDRLLARTIRKSGNTNGKIAGKKRVKDRK